MTEYERAQVASVELLTEKLRGGLEGEIGVALAVVGLSADRAAKEVMIRDDMIRVAHDVGASIRQISEVSGLGRKTVAAIIESHSRPDDS